MPTLPPAMLHLLAPFAPLFARRVWCHALVLVTGAILTPGRLCWPFTPSEVLFWQSGRKSAGIRPRME
jgi:hypothetical protein